MKKYISMILILVLVMSFGAAAFADYTVSATVSGVGGSLNATTSGTIADDGSFTFTASPDVDYDFDHWAGGTGDMSSPSYNTTKADDGRTLVAFFSRKLHTVTTSTSGNGKVSPVSLQGYNGENYSFTATPDPGFVFDHWEENGVNKSSSANYSGTFGTSDSSLKAYFKTQTPQYTVSVSAVPSAYGTVSGNGTYDANATATVSATPNTNYVFLNWTDASNNVISTNQSYSFTVTADTALTANFAVNPTPSAAVYHTITYLDDNGAFIAADSKEDNISYYISHARAFKAGYTQVAWRTTKDTSGTTYDFGKAYEVNADLTLYPVWSKSGGTTPPAGTCTLTLAPGTYGSGTAFSQNFYSGTALTLPGAGYFSRSGYTQTGWSFDPNGTTCDKALSASTWLYYDTTLYPYWSPVSTGKTIYIDYSDYGAVYWGSAKMERGRTITLQPNQSVTLTFSPVNQYYVYNVNVNGYNLGSRDSYTFNYNEMSGNKSIYVRFGSIYGRPKTGDDSDLGLWIILGMSSMAGCAAAAIVSKKRREH